MNFGGWRKTNESNATNESNPRAQPFRPQPCVARQLASREADSQPLALPHEVAALVGDYPLVNCHKVFQCPIFCASLTAIQLPSSSNWLTSRPSYVRLSPWRCGLVSLDELRGAVTPSLMAMITRPLEAKDVLALQNPQGTQPVPLKKVKETHHRLARLLAQGIPAVEVSAMTGFTQSRISILKTDPSFQELLSFYTGKIQTAFADMHEQLAGVSLDVLHELRDRLHESPEALSSDQLMKFLDSLLDRTGFGVQTKSKTETTTLTLNSAELTALKAAAQQGAAGNAIRQTATTISDLLGAPESSPQGEEAPLGGAQLNGAELFPSSSAGSESEGSGV